MQHFTDSLFEELPVEKVTRTKVVGEPEKTDIATSQCPSCKQWFAKSKIGGHTTACLRARGVDPMALPYRHRPRRVDYSYEDPIDLDITVAELQAYRQSHPTCEICGKTAAEVTKWNSQSAVKQLCVDHDHTTGKFRGLLCQICNRQLGWYENNKENIQKYLDK